MVLDTEAIIERYRSMQATLAESIELMHGMRETLRDCDPETRAKFRRVLPSIESMCRRQAIWIAAARKLIEQEREAAR
jgi:hypothetical protein